MPRKRNGNAYEPEFKAEAIRLMLTSPKTIKQLARELEVSSWTLGAWKKAHLEAMECVEQDGVVRSAAEVEAENRQMRRKIENLERDCELLKKVTAMFSQETWRDQNKGSR